MMLPRKALPHPSLQLVLRPQSDDDYQHFEHAGGVPFDAATTAFSRVNAWWLADAALLSYWDPAVAAARFHDLAGLRSQPIAKRGTQAFVASTNTFVVVVFRGTESDSIRDFVTNVRLQLTSWDVAAERVHEGFRDALEDVWPALVDTLKSLGTCPVWFTGHSLGGALATLAADRFERTRSREGFGELGGVYTFGSPLVGDRPFAEAFNRRCGDRSFRFVNDRDTVTRVPPALLGYHHVDNAQSVGFNDPDVLLSEPLIDHTPRRYAVLVWNALVKELDAV